MLSCLRENTFFTEQAKQLRRFLLQCILVFNFANFAPTKYGEYEFPWYMDGLGWMMTALTVSVIPIVALYKICTADASLSLLQKV